MPDGPRRYEVKTWFATSLPIFVVEGFYLLLTYVDILALEHFRSPDEVAVYYAAARLLAIVAFVYFAIAGATTHKFTEYHVAGDSKRLASFFAETIKWTFWPSLAACAIILALGKPLLALFGPSFERGYPVMFILAVGMLARAAVGPAERLLNMLGERKPCAFIYAGAFAINLVLCAILIPRIGIEGAAVATTTAIVVELILLFLVAKRRLGFHVFILGGRSHVTLRWPHAGSRLHIPLVPAKAGPQSLRRMLDARFRGHERRDIATPYPAAAAGSPCRSWSSAWRR